MPEVVIKGTHNDIISGRVAGKCPIIERDRTESWGSQCLGDSLVVATVAGVQCIDSLARLKRHLIQMQVILQEWE